MYLGFEIVVSFVGIEYFDLVFFSGLYGVLKGCVVMVIVVIMFVLVFVGGVNVGDCFCS